MKQFSLIILLLLSASALFAQDDKSYVHKGNELYQQQKYKDAEASYRKSVEKKAQNVEGNFNLGDALYKQKKFDEAGQQFNNIATSATDKNVASKAYHNLGNSFMESKKYRESIDAYKKALINNPADDQTRYNMAYAQQMLKKQQDQQKKKDKDDKNKDKDKKNKDKDKDKKDKDKKDQDKKDKDKDQNKPDQDKKDQKNGQQPQPDKLSKEDAQRMLDALNNDEQKTQDKLKDKKLKGAKVHIDKDW